MSAFLEILDVFAREVLDSRGNPTVEAEVTVCCDGFFTTGRASVPSGASTGKHEAVELRDQEMERYQGKGVHHAVENVNTVLKKVLLGQNALDQVRIDTILCRTDRTENKEKLGANALLAVSLACARAAAEALDLPLYRYLGGVFGVQMPVPMLNILNGGKHAANTVDFQEFMIMPVGAVDSDGNFKFRDGLRWCVEIYHKLQEILQKEGLSTAVGDEGGFAPDLKDAEDVLDHLMQAVQDAGYEPGKEIMFALDVAASELYNPDSGYYYFPGESKRKEAELFLSVEAGTQPDTESAVVHRTTDEMIAYYQKLTEKYPICSIEDGLYEDDWEGWKQLTEALGEKVQLVGDDLFVTNVKRLRYGIKQKAANAILIKVNQIGTLTEAMQAIVEAKKAGYRAVVSHRSGETEDSFIADLSVALNCGQIKTGAPCRGERTAKYNQLLRIEEEAGVK